MTTTPKIRRLATLAAPAHRHLGPNLADPAWTPMRQALFELMAEHDVRRHVSLAAPGLDQLAASVAGWLGIEHVVIRPFPDHERTWPPEQAEYARNLVDTARQVVTISQNPSREAVGLAYQEVVARADALFAIDADDSVIVARAIENARMRAIPVFLSRGGAIAEGRYELMLPGRDKGGDAPWDA